MRALRRPSVSRALIAVGVALLSASCTTGDATPPTDHTESINPLVYYPTEWLDLLGGDVPSDGASPLDYNAFEAASDVPTEHRAFTHRLIKDVVLAEASGLGQDVFGDYFARNHPPIAPPETPPSGKPTRFCTEVSVRAVSAIVAPIEPDGGFVKGLVFWSGTCPFPPPIATLDAGVPIYSGVIYITQDDLYPHPLPPEIAQEYGGWVPIRPAEMPGSATWLRPPSTPPAAWEVSPLTGCGQEQLLARLEVVAAWGELCAAAERDTVPLYAIDALRNADDQRERFERAIEIYGSERAARGRVAFSDGLVCESLHCAGEAIDVLPDSTVQTWLAATVGCITERRAYVPPPCSSADTAVSRLESFGFVAPNASFPTHLEFALGTITSDAGLYGDCSPGAVDTPLRVELLFRCRVVEAGLGFEMETTPAEAVQVAQCTSNLNPFFRSFDGRFAKTPNPRTGVVDTREGIFGLSDEVARRWIPAPSLRDNATANIDAAARLVVNERLWGRWGWDVFACTAFDDGSTTAPLD